MVFETLLRMPTSSSGLTRSGRLLKSTCLRSSAWWNRNWPSKAPIRPELDTPLSRHPRGGQQRASSPLTELDELMLARAVGACPGFTSG